MNLILQTYSDIDPIYNYQILTAPDSVAVDSLRKQESDIAAITPNLVSNEMLADASNDGLISLPFAALSVAIYYNFPLTMTGASLPLLLDMDLLVKIFTGNYYYIVIYRKVIINSYSHFLLIFLFFLI